MNKPFKYTLEVGSKKHHCPGCQKKSLVRYVYTGTRDYVGENFGRCDRENNCGYHLVPEKDISSPPNPPTKKDIPEPKTLKPTPEYLESLKNQQSGNLARFCMGKLGMTKEHLVKWGLFSSWKFDAFVLSNLAGEAVNVKFVVYTPDGKRDKSEKPDGSPAYFPHYLGKSYLKKQGILIDPKQLEEWQDHYKFDRCFYGAHLWDPEQNTCLVESEKTALIASWFFPGVNWLATGGSNGMKYEQFELFHGYKGRIRNLVDNDPAGYEKSKTIQWLDLLADLRDDPEDIMSINIFPSSPEGWDIADAIIKDGYRDKDKFYHELNHAMDCRTDYSIDESTGEVTAQPVKRIRPDEKEYKRATQVAERIYVDQVPIMLSSEVNTFTMMESLACFGERGRSIARKIQSVVNIEPETTDAAYNLAIGTPHKDAGYFFAKAKAHGVDIRYIKTARSEAAEGAEGIDANEISVTWPDGMEKMEGFDHKALMRDVAKYNFIEYKNCTWYGIFTGSENKGNLSLHFDRISNFTIRPLYLIKSKTDPKRLFEIKNIFGIKYIIDIPAKALVSMTEFQVFCEGQGNFLFEGSKVQFTKIKRKLYDHTKDAEEVKMLGWQDEGFYAFANGAFRKDHFDKVDTYGIIRHLVEKNDREAEEKYFFIPAMSSIYKDEKDQYDMEKKFVYVKRPDVKFADWARLFYNVFGDNGMIGMAYYLSSLYRDMIYARFKFFPHLFHFGPPGTGKSTMCWSIQYLFGLERKPFMLNAGTAVAFHRTFAQFRNAVIWFDEYNNNMDMKRVQDLKSAYDGAGHVKSEWSQTGGTSNRTNTTPVESACNISGQELPIADNALFKRCILLQYYQTTFSDEDKEQLSKLQKLQEKGLSHLTGAITIFREKMEKEYFPTFDKVEKEILTALQDDPTIESRIVKNICVVATTYRILKDELNFPYSWDDFMDVMLRNVRSQNALISNAKETNQFWDMVEYCISEGELKDEEDFKIEDRQMVKVIVDRKTVERNLGGMRKVLYIRLATAHPKYQEALRKQGEKKGMDKGSLAHYLSHSPGFIGMVSSTRFKNGDRNFASSAYAFEYRYLEDAGYNFDRVNFQVDDEDQNPEDDPEQVFEKKEGENDELF
jgi:hypothetical protein